MAAGNARVQEGRDRMDGESPQDGNVDKGLDPLGRLNLVPFGLKSDPADDDVQTQVPDEHHHVIEHDGMGRGVKHDVEHALGLTKVHHDEERAHDHGRDGHEFTKDDHAFELFVVMEVGGQHQHDGRGRHTHEIGELRNVQSPRNVTAEAGDGETVLQLIEVHKAATRDKNQQEDQPHVVGLRTVEQFFKHGLFSLDKVVDAGLGAQAGLAANTVIGGQSLAHR